MHMDAETSLHDIFSKINPLLACALRNTPDFLFFLLLYPIDFTTGMISLKETSIESVFPSKKLKVNVQILQIKSVGKNRI